MSSRVLAAATLLSLLAPSEGHAYLVQPASRNALHPQANCPHCMQAGGPPTVKERANGVWPTMNAPGSHGLCGDPVQAAAVVPLAEEPMLVPDEPVVNYEPGSVVEFWVGINAHHAGHFEFRICDRALDGRTLTSAQEGQDCLNTWVLERADVDPSCTQPDDSRPDCQPIDSNHPGRWYLPPVGATTLPAGVNLAGVSELYVMRYKIPSDLSCEHCTLQWYWSTGNTCFYDGDYFEYFRNMAAAGWDAENWAPHAFASWANVDNKACNGDVFGEEFWNCADISVTAGAGQTPETSVAPVTTQPATTSAPATTQPATTAAPATTQPATTAAPATTQPATTTAAPATTQPATTTTAPATTQPATTTAAPATTQPAATTAVPATTQKPAGGTGCYAIPGNAQATTDAQCAPCADGQTWWPCNVVGLCQGNCGATATTAAPAEPETETDTTPEPEPDCVEVWGKCGGNGWTGATCCRDGAVCTVDTEWYSQCLPAAALHQQAERKAIKPHSGFLATALIQAGAALERASSEHENSEEL